MKRKLTAGGAVVLGLMSLSCFGGGERGMFANMPSDTIPIVLGLGDLLITNPDSSMDLGLVGDTVLMQFGAKVRAKLRHDLDTNNIQSRNGFGAAIERAVKRKVGSALGHRLVMPLSEIDSVSLNGNKIEFAYHDRTRHGFNFDSMKNDNHSALESFRPEDARRFVDAVRARKMARATAAR